MWLHSGPVILNDGMPFLVEKKFGKLKVAAYKFLRCTVIHQNSEKIIRLGDRDEILKHFYDIFLGTSKYARGC